MIRREAELIEYTRSHYAAINVNKDTYDKNDPKRKLLPPDILYGKESDYNLDISSGNLLDNESSFMDDGFSAGFAFLDAGSQSSRKPTTPEPIVNEIRHDFVSLDMSPKQIATGSYQYFKSLNWKEFANRNKSLVSKFYGQALATWYCLKDIPLLHYKLQIAKFRFNINFSNTNPERDFKEIKHIVNPWQNRMTVDNIASHLILKQQMRYEHKHINKEKKEDWENLCRILSDTLNVKVIIEKHYGMLYS